MADVPVVPVVLKVPVVPVVLKVGGSTSTAVFLWPVGRYHTLLNAITSSRFFALCDRVMTTMRRDYHGWNWAFAFTVINGWGYVWLPARSALTMAWVMFGCQPLAP